jgi:hypothetical protein
MIELYERIPIENSTWVFDCNELEITIYETGVIRFANQEYEYITRIDLLDLDEIVRRGKMFKDRRTAYLLKQ